MADDLTGYGGTSHRARTWTVLHWLALVPVAIAGAYVVGFVTCVLATLCIWLVFRAEPDELLQVVTYVVAGGAGVRIAAAVAPSHKRLAALGAIGLALLYSAGTLCRFYRWVHWPFGEFMLPLIRLIPLNVAAVIMYAIVARRVVPEPGSLRGEQHERNRSWRLTCVWIVVGLFALAIAGATFWLLEMALDWAVDLFWASTGVGV